MGQFKGAIGGLTGLQGKDNGEKKQYLVSNVGERKGCRLIISFLFSSFTGIN